MSTVELLETFNTGTSEVDYAGPESRLDGWSNIASIVGVGGAIQANHPTMGTCGCPMPAQPNTPPSPCGC